MQVVAPSKINLFLRVTGTLPGGFHSIETLFVPLAQPADVLTFEFVEDSLAETRVFCTHPAVPNHQKNLCWKAAELLRKALGFKDSLRITIDKHIPVAGGMAGGSTDAAAVIRALQTRYGTLPDGGCAVALECGSDVPFFLNPVPSIGRGRGEILTPVEGLHFPEIGIHPSDFPISARWAYSHVPEETAHDARDLDSLIAALRSSDFPAASKYLRNDLAPAAFHKFPLLAAKKAALESDGRRVVQLSGSGPTLFSFITRFTAEVR